jgi:hypothetical protein
VPERSRSEVVIRSRPTLDGAEFSVVDAKSLRSLGGPFALLSDAISFAVSQITADGRLLYEALDERGRTTGGPVLLRTIPA